MHDPEVVALEIRRPWKSRRHGARGFTYRPAWVTVWHIEPGGGDIGTVCKDMPPSYPRGRRHSLHRARWVWRHRQHCKVHVEPWLHFVRRFERCVECGRRMNKAARIGDSWNGTGVLHSECQSLRGLRRQTETLRAVIEGSTERQHLSALRFAYQITPWWEPEARHDEAAQ